MADEVDPLEALKKMVDEAAEAAAEASKLDPTTSYVAQYYQSEEAKLTPYAITNDESLWAPQAGSENMLMSATTLETAIITARNWAAGGGAYKTCRVVQINESAIPIAVVWMTQWQGPSAVAGGAQGGVVAGTPGETIKVLVWMDRNAGPPDHWHFETLKEWLSHSGNSWDLVYGREITRRGREILWSLRINVWPNYDAKPLIQWDWWKVFGYNKKVNPDKVEPIRAHPIEPRSFPSGVELVDCTRCEKTIPKNDAWWSYAENEDEWGPYCSCYCIDHTIDTDYMRETPDGEEFEMPGCEVERAKALV